MSGGEQTRHARLGYGPGPRWTTPSRTCSAFELTALFDERERLRQAAAAIADRADHQRRLADFFERLIRHFNQDSNVQAG
jgi:hypothetical protein